MIVVKKFVFSIVSLAVVIVAAELFLIAIRFHYYPVEMGFKISPSYEIFEQVGDHYQTKKEKTTVFHYQQFPVKKDKNEVRVFIMGGSSVHSVSYAEALKKNLEALVAPARYIMIINIGGIAYGTNRLLMHLQEIVKYRPDLVILYSGHNEFEEEFMRKTFFKETALGALNEALIRLSRGYQFLSMLYNKTITSIFRSYTDNEIPFFPPDLQVKWGMTFDKPSIHKNYRRNVIKMIKLARNNDTPILISTVAYNRMWAPFKPADAMYQHCEDLYGAGDFKAAKSCFEDALDADLQPHRANETSNRIIKEIAWRYQVPLADIDARIIESAQNGIPGKDLFQDHCHLNAWGREILLEVLFETVKENKLLH